MQKVKKSASVLVSLSLAASFITAPSFAAANGQTEDNPQSAAPQQMIVKFKDNAPKIKNYHVEDTSVGGDRSLVSLDVPGGKTIHTALKEMNARKDVEYAEPDYQIKLNSVPNDPLYAKQWYHKVIHTDQAWELTKGSEATVVAVIDDGIDVSHPDLQGRITAPFDIVGNTDKTIPAGEHGTHVAGIIAASADNGAGGSGIAPDVKIMPINIFGTDSYGHEAADTSDVIDAIHYAVDHGAKIISMSLGEYEKSTALDEAVQDAYKKGVLIIAAAGNDHTSFPNYPAAYDHVISVTSTNSNDRISSFSNYGSTIDLAAPGNNILSTLPGNRYGYLSGTSMAVPMVSGVAALVWSKNPSMTNAQVADDLFQSAVDLGTSGKDTVYGWGRIDAAKALEVKTLTPPAPEVQPLTDKDTVLSGTVAANIVNGTVVVSNDNGEIGRTPVDSQFHFSLQIPAQKAGTKLSVRVIDSQGNQSSPTVITVGFGTSLAAPTVNEISDRSTRITGKTAPNVKVTAKNGHLTYRGRSNARGEYTIAIFRPAAGSVFKVYATDRSGKKSEVVKAVVSDKTAPLKPQVNPVSTSDTKVTGLAEANSQVTVLAGSTVVGTAVADQNHYFSVTIPQQAANTKLTVVSTDSAKNQSKPTTVVVRDQTKLKRGKGTPYTFADSPYFYQWIQAFINLLLEG